MFTTMLLAALLVARDHANPQRAPVLRVYLLAGQSNMEGHGVVDLGGDDVAGKRDYNSGRGNLANFIAMPANAKKWGDLRSADGSWFVRDDVFVSYRVTNEISRCEVLVNRQERREKSKQSCRNKSQ